MHQAAHTYAATAQKTASPRELEAQLLLRAAAKLQAVIDGTVTKSDEIREALTYNRRLWTILVSSVTGADNPLPQPIKQNLANLGVFILNRSIKLEITPEADGLRPLVNINREIAAGLSGRA